MVSEGQELVIIEAMKMQNSLHAGKTGKVSDSLKIFSKFQATTFRGSQNLNTTLLCLFE